ncbi:MAG TPA: DNA mismatch repair endonuclease MutL [Terriglobia bacterium]|nr:DNA mismatch repair endonuclease MutL [Terriglobia bacterium]
MSVIHILPEAVANKIAAGEVVERPASVVKELLENSIDAGAQRVEINLESGGKRLVRVVDDGCGMSKDDSLLAFERHATSKIRSADDLFEVSTLGFRGEALPSIAAVSRLTLETRHASESAGTRLEIAGGKLRDVKEQAWAGGTRIEVRDLFFNTPARRKFLKSESTELGHIATLVTHYALAHPEKSFRLTSLASEILNVSPVSTSRERVYQVMGGQLLEQLVDIAPLERRVPPVAPTGAPDEPEDEPAVVRASGFVSRPEVQKLNRNNIYFFVNRRLVRDRLILHAITQAYRNILPANVFPVALIFLDIPASQVDVNVHPSKTEVRFRNSSFIHDFVRDSIRQGLIAAQPVAAFPQPKGASGSKRDGDEAEIKEKLGDDPLVMPGPQTADPLSFEGAQSAGADFHLSAPRPQPTTGSLPLSDAGMDLDAPPEFGAGLSGLPETPMAATSQSEFPADLTPLGQVQESFIVATNASGLWIIDQHVAHERVLFEHHMRMRREKRVEGQRLLMPIVVELKPEQQATFQDIASELNANGFEVEPFGQRTVAIKTAPADIRADDVDRLLLEILDGVGREAREISLEGLRLKIAASVSCHAAVKINMGLERNKMQWLLRELAKTDCPMTCPHGRPIVLRYGLKEIQKAFKRI